MGPVVDFPGGFGPVWLLDTTGPTFEAGSTHFSFFHESRGVMEFPLAGLPHGSRIHPPPRPPPALRRRPPPLPILPRIPRRHGVPAGRHPQRVPHQLRPAPLQRGL